MHCSIINSLFTMPFYKNESGIIFFNFICLLVFLVKLSIIHLFYYLKDDGNKRFFNDNKTYSYVI